MEGISNYFVPTSVSYSQSGAGGILGGTDMVENGAMQDVQASIGMQAGAMSNTSDPSQESNQSDEEDIYGEGPAQRRRLRREARRRGRGELRHPERLGRRLRGRANRSQSRRGRGGTGAQGGPGTPGCRQGGAGGRPAVIARDAGPGPAGCRRDDRRRAPHPDRRPGEPFVVHRRQRAAFSDRRSPAAPSRRCGRQPAQSSQDQRPYRRDPVLDRRHLRQLGAVRRPRQRQPARPGRHGRARLPHPRDCRSGRHQPFDPADPMAAVNLRITIVLKHLAPPPTAASLAPEPTVAEPAAMEPEPAATGEATTEP